MSTFHKNVSKLGWDEVKRRQIERLPLVHEWIQLTNMTEDCVVMDIGSGPGVFVREYAKVVGVKGQIHVVELSADAIEFLKKEMFDIASYVIPICMDAEKSLPDLPELDIVMLTDVLHHSNESASLLRNIFEAVSASTRILISEFDPDATGLLGPPLENRMPADILRELVQTVGFTIVKEGKQGYEHYYLLVQKTFFCFD